jgi:hypothetical protein
MQFLPPLLLHLDSFVVHLACKFLIAMTTKYDFINEKKIFMEHSMFEESVILFMFVLYTMH